eukprot:COSAG04_NODE_176_length_21411_cov_10.599240_19_plen_137_part_00
MQGGSRKEVEVPGGAETPGRTRAAAGAAPAGTRRALFEGEPAAMGRPSSITPDLDGDLDGVAVAEVVSTMGAPLAQYAELFRRAGLHPDALYELVEEPWLMQAALRDGELMAEVRSCAPPLRQQLALRIFGPVAGR